MEKEKWCRRGHYCALETSAIQEKLSTFLSQTQCASLRSGVTVLRELGIRISGCKY